MGFAVKRGTTITPTAGSHGEMSLINEPVCFQTSTLRPEEVRRNELRGVVLSLSFGVAVRTVGVKDVEILLGENTNVFSVGTFLVEDDEPIGFREESVVLTFAHVESGMVFSAALTNNNVPGVYLFATVTLNP
jgi:hypothetical protein